MKKIKYLFFAIMAVCLLGTAGTASADIVSYLTYPNENSLPIMEYAKVNGHLGASPDTYHISVALDSNLSDSLHGNGTHFGLDEFYFNTDLNISDLQIQNLPTNWSADTSIGDVAGFGKFDLQLTEKPRKTRLTLLQFDIVYTGNLSNLNSGALSDSNFYILSDTPADNGQGYFAAHIAGFDFNQDGEDDSTFVRDGNQQVPEPGTLILLGSGLVGIAFYRRRRME